MPLSRTSETSEQSESLAQDFVILIHVTTRRGDAIHNCNVAKQYSALKILWWVICAYIWDFPERSSLPIFVSSGSDIQESHYDRSKYARNDELCTSGVYISQI